MTLSEFVQQVKNFDGIGINAKIHLFAWFLHTYRNTEVFDNAAMRDCFREAHLVPPDVSIYLPRMAAKRPAELIRSKGGYQLAGPFRRQLDAQYGTARSVIAVTRLLGDLPTKVANITEKVFLSETLDCYRVGAFRATTVMAWNLAFDHLASWIMSDAARIAAFNTAIAARYPRKAGLKIGKLDDFSELKESETIDVCRTAGLIARNTSTILHEKLKRRNMAAHPSSTKFTQHQADEVITDLVNNVVLALV